MGHGFVVSAVAGVLTGYLAVRDILCNDVPFVFRRELYASISCGSHLLLGLSGLGLSLELTVISTLIFGFTRLIAIYFGLEMPKLFIKMMMQNRLLQLTNINHAEFDVSMI